LQYFFDRKVTQPTYNTTYPLINTLQLRHSKQTQSY